MPLQKALPISYDTEQEFQPLPNPAQLYNHTHILLPNGLPGFLIGQWNHDLVALDILQIFHPVAWRRIARAEGKQIGKAA